MHSLHGQTMCLKGPRHILIPPSNVALASFSDNKMAKGLQHFDDTDSADWSTYAADKLAFHEVRIPKGNWQDAPCPCQIYLKDYICKHILWMGLCLWLPHCTAPPDTKKIILGSKKHRGRPSIARRALFVQLLCLKLGVSMTYLFFISLGALRLT